MVSSIVQMPSAPGDALRIERYYPFEEGGRRLIFVVENAAFAELDEPTWYLAHKLLEGGKQSRRALLADLEDRFGAEAAQESIEAFEQLQVLQPFNYPRYYKDLEVVPNPPLGSLVLHVSHDCNMRCGYCYADYGRYGGEFGHMTTELALQHTERFFDQLGDTNKLHMTFFGGEPLMNMEPVFAAHKYAKERAQKEGRAIAFGITTNGTLLTDELVTFFKEERFTVTVSIDGPPDVNDRLRTLTDASSSYDAIVDKVRGTGLSAVARVTLTRKCLDVARIVRHLLGAGFREVGVSPVATGETRFDLAGEDFDKLMQELRALADDFVEEAKKGRVIPFSNLRTLLEQIAAGDPRPVPCGAGTRLVAADNKGDWYACHRLVGQEDFHMGHVEAGLDGPKRFELLKKIHPRDREPCQDCWARYLCGGGCHHLAWLHTEHRDQPWALGEQFCDFLRAWYRLGLATYARLAEEAPDTLARLARKKTSSACSQPQGQ